MRVTSLMDEAKSYQALPLTAKTIGRRTQDGQDGTLDFRTSFVLHRIKTVLKGSVKGIAEICSERRDSIDN